jgi:Uma2 family endonuclease
MEPARRQVVSAQAYLEREYGSETKHEYLRGEILAMADASPRHNLIASNVVRSIGNSLRGRPCVVLGSDQRIKVPATDLYTYPDVAVICGRPKTDPLDESTLVNPLLVAEVLSDSTEAYDRGAKFAHYRNLPSLREYLLVSQKERRVEHYRLLEPGQWLLTEYAGDAAMPLPTLGIELPLAEIYDKLELLATEGEPLPGAPQVGSLDPARGSVG